MASNTTISSRPEVDAVPPAAPAAVPVPSQTATASVTAPPLQQPSPARGPGWNPQQPLPAQPLGQQLDVLPAAVFWLMSKSSNKGLFPNWPTVANTGIRSDWSGLGIRLERRIDGLCLVSWQHWCTKSLTLWRRFRHRNVRPPGVSQCRFWPWRLQCGLSANDWLSGRCCQFCQGLKSGGGICCGIV